MARYGNKKLEKYRMAIECIRRQI